MHLSAPFSGRRRWHSSLLAVAVTAPFLATAVQGSVHGSAPERPAVTDDPASRHKVTLVTGDVVTVTTLADGKQTADVDRPDSAVGGVRIQEIRGDLYVIPDEASALLGADKLDRRLFDVTDLIEMGYDDAATATVPMIASYTPPKTRAAGRPTAPRGSRLVRELPAIDGAALDAPKAQARTFWTTVAPSRRGRSDARRAAVSPSCGWTVAYRST